jgi:hypothetical protein
MVDEIQPPQYECREENLTERSVGLHHALQIRAVDFEQSAGFAGTASDQRTAAREQAYLAGEVPAAEDSKDGLIPV